MSAELRSAGGTSLAAMAAAVAQLADGTARRRAVGALATELRNDVRNAFASKRAPGGNAWAKPARPQRHPLLVKTSRLRGAALRVLFFGGGVRVVLPDYGDHHLYGTRRMPARPFLPADPMPAELVQRYQRAVIEAIKPR